MFIILNAIDRKIQAGVEILFVYLRIVFEFMQRNYIWNCLKQLVGPEQMIKINQGGSFCSLWSNIIVDRTKKKTESLQTYIGN